MDALEWRLVDEQKRRQSCEMHGATSRGKWRPVSQLLAAPSSAQQHTAQEQADQVLRELGAHPAGLSLRRLAERVGQVGSDGASAAGGPQRNVSALASEVLLAKDTPADRSFDPSHCAYDRMGFVSSD